MCQESSGKKAGEAAIAELSERFSADWRAGRRPHIEDLLDQVDGSQREILLHELLVVELECRGRLKERPSHEEYRDRFPRHAVVVASVFDGPSPPATERTRRIADDVSESAPDITPVPAAALCVRCPQCQGRTPLSEEVTLDDLTCPECGSQFGMPFDQAGDAPPRGVEELEPGQTIAHFRLEEHLGEGGFGAVWKAWDMTLDRAVAVKIPHGSRMGLEETEKSLREARAAAQLQHPHIVGVHEVAVDGRRVGIVSDFIAGAPLDEWTSAQRPGHRDSAQLCLKIARALHHAHEHGIIHRDLKPSNIMIDADGHPHIMDFGMAKRTAGEVTMTADGTIMGTPAYMSPEQAQGHSHQADPRTDVYSLGVILFELLTGERPFRGNVQMLVKQVVEDDPPSPRKLDHQLPRDLETVCLKCLRKEPGSRYASAEELADELQRFLDGQPIWARPVGRIERAWRWCRRNPLVAASAATAVTGLLFGVVALLVSYAQTTQALRETRTAKNQAEARLLFTKQAVDELFTEISEDTLLNQSGMQPLRHQLLLRARDYYKKFVRESGGDAAIRDELGLAHFRVGLITLEVGKAEDAISSFEEARRMQEELCDAAPDDLDRLQALGETLNAQGRALHYQGGRFEQALEAFNTAVKIREKLVGGSPTATEYQRQLANATMNIGLLQQPRDPNRAIEFYQRAQDIRGEALKLAPAHKKLRRDQAKGEYNLAKAANETGDYRRADESLRQAREWFQDLVNEDPRDLNAQHQLAVCTRLRADVKCSMGKIDDAPPLYQDARDIMERLAEKNPGVPEYQVGLAEIYMAIGELELEFARRRGEAATLDPFEKAYSMLLKLGDRRLEHPRYCRDFVLTLAVLQRLHPDPNRRAELLRQLQLFRDQLAEAVKRSPDAKGLQIQLELLEQVLEQAGTTDATGTDHSGPRN